MDETELEAPTFILGGGRSALFLLVLICCSARDQTQGKPSMYCTIPPDLGFIETSSHSEAQAVLELISHLPPN